MKRRVNSGARLCLGMAASTLEDAIDLDRMCWLAASRRKLEHTAWWVEQAIKANNQTKEPHNGH